jgi:hypothetical protein
MSEEDDVCEIIEDFENGKKGLSRSFSDLGSEKSIAKISEGKHSKSRTNFFAVSESIVFR